MEAGSVLIYVPTFSNECRIHCKLMPTLAWLLTQILEVDVSQKTKLACTSWFRLPSYVSSTKRVAGVSDICPLCHEEVETIIRVLVSCRFAKLSWWGGGFGSDHRWMDSLLRVGLYQFWIMKLVIKWDWPSVMCGFMERDEYQCLARNSFEWYKVNGCKFLIMRIFILYECSEYLTVRVFWNYFNYH